MKTLAEFCDWAKEKTTIEYIRTYAAEQQDIPNLKQIYCSKDKKCLHDFFDQVSQIEAAIVPAYFGGGILDNDEELFNRLPLDGTINYTDYIAYVWEEFIETKLDDVDSVKGYLRFTAPDETVAELVANAATRAHANGHAELFDFFKKMFTALPTRVAWLKPALFAIFSDEDVTTSVYSESTTDDSLEQWIIGLAWDFMGEEEPDVDEYCDYMGNDAKQSAHRLIEPINYKKRRLTKSQKRY